MSVPTVISVVLLALRVLGMTSLWRTVSGSEDIKQAVGERVRDRLKERAIGDGSFLELIRLFVANKDLFLEVVQIVRDIIDAVSGSGPVVTIMGAEECSVLCEECPDCDAAVAAFEKLAA